MTARQRHHSAPRTAQQARDHRKLEAQVVTYVDCTVWDAPTRTGTFYLPAGCCTDMSGAVRYFRDRHPEVQRVEVLAGGRIDTIYTREGNQWQAHVAWFDGSWRYAEPCEIRPERSVRR